MTPTAGPAVVLNAIVSIEDTPLASAPIQFGAVVATSDENGLISVSVPRDSSADVASALKAIKIEKIADTPTEVLAGSGLELENIATQRGGFIDIVASRRVNPEPICRVFDSNLGVEALRFPFTNRYGESLSVDSAGLNSISSPSGVPYPSASFGSTDLTLPPGYLGFTWPVEYFTWFDSTQGREIVSATWKLIGKEVSVSQGAQDIPICQDSGGLGDCSPLSQSLTNRVYEQAFSSVTVLSNEAMKLKKKGVWRPTGKIRTPYYAVAADSLRSIRALLRLPPGSLVCGGITPQSCRQVEIPKAQLQQQVDRIFKTKLPRALRSLVRFIPAERKKFRAELSKLPDRYVTCGQ
jgi:hypothetical protein